MSYSQLSKEIAVWLVRNTDLEFEKIAEFCDMSVVEVAAIEDNYVHQDLSGIDPRELGILSDQNIQDCSTNGVALPKYLWSKNTSNIDNVSKNTKYKSDAIVWLLLHYPVLKNIAVARLTKSSALSVKKIKQDLLNNVAMNSCDPRAVGLCSQEMLEKELEKKAVTIVRKSKNVSKTIKTIET